MSPRILVIADAGPRVGGGHVMRSLTLSRALQALGARPTFLATPEVSAILDAFDPAMPREAVTALTPDALPDATTGIGFDAVIFDHYGLARAEHEAAARGRPVLVIDDLADRPLGANVVLDPGPDRTPADYALFAPAAELLLGPQHAALRPEFAALREAALARRARASPSRVLVALGLTDVGAISARVVEVLRRRSAIGAIDVALGAGAPSLPVLRRIAAHDPRLTLHVDARDMARLTAEADLAVGAAGSTTWERCVLGLPSILLTLAPNQASLAAAMAKRKAALVLDVEAPDFDAALDRALVRLTADAPLRTSIAQASAAMCDGLGAQRSAAVFLRRVSAA